MTRTLPAFSPQFDDAAVKAIRVLEIAKAHLHRMRTNAQAFEDQYALLHLYSLALLGSQRALDLVEKAPDDLDADEKCDLCELLATTHDRLIEQTSALYSFAALEFVSEFGSLCRRVRRYVDSH